MGVERWSSDTWRRETDVLGDSDMLVPLGDRLVSEYQPVDRLAFL
jgi:hypothetical protein